jgi:hypothetical protein
MDDVNRGGTRVHRCALWDGVPDWNLTVDCCFGEPAHAISDDYS